MTDEARTLEIAVLGVEAEAFQHSAIGRHLAWKADSEERKLLQDLREADPMDLHTNTVVRQRLDAIDMFRRWIDEAIRSGQLAKDQIDEMEEYED